MAYSDAKSVKEYINRLEPKKAEVIKKIRDKMIKNMPKGIEETMNWGMICYEIPLKDYPNTYNNQPLMYAALSSQKRHFAIHLTGSYMDVNRMDKILKAFDDMGIKPNMGKSCIRFTKIDKIPVDTIIGVLKSYTIEDFIKFYESMRNSHIK